MALWATAGASNALESASTEHTLHDATRFAFIHCSRAAIRAEASSAGTASPVPKYISGLSIVGEGEWAAAKHEGHGKRAWKKLHLGVDRFGVIVAEVRTDGNIDDAKTALDLIDEVEGDITSITGQRRIGRRRTPRSSDCPVSVVFTTATSGGRSGWPPSTQSAEQCLRTALAHHPHLSALATGAQDRSRLGRLISREARLGTGWRRERAPRPS